MPDYCWANQQSFRQLILERDRNLGAVRHCLAVAG